MNKAKSISTSLSTFLSTSQRFISLILLVIILTINTLQSQPRVLLSENFNRDLREEANHFPWDTPELEGTRWHYNATPPYYRAEENYTDYSWGLQNYIFNPRVTPHDAHKYALWCAYTNRDNTEDPHWPEEDDFMNLQNSWVWWGPFDLSDAEYAVLNYWLYIDIGHYARDSLSVVALTDPEYLTSNHDEFRNNVPLGKAYRSRLAHDWRQQQVYLDSLTLQGERISVLGEENVYLAFVWQSDRFEVTGKGAFIDDVSLTVCSGLDIRPVGHWFGHALNADSIEWSSDNPRYLDEVFFRVDWVVEGFGRTWDFDIDCMLNNRFVHQEVRDVQAGDQNIFSSATRESFLIGSGMHNIYWELDSPADAEGFVPEYDESNNSYDLDFEVAWTPALILDVLTPAENIILAEDSFAVGWEIYDSLPDMNEFYVELSLVPDTVRIDPDSEIPWDDYTQIHSSSGWPDGNQHVMVNRISRFMDPGQRYNVMAFIRETTHPRTAYAISPGTIMLEELGAGRNSVTSAGTPSMSITANPNPFNSFTSIRYDLANRSQVDLKLLNINGQVVESLVRESQDAGSHIHSFSPDQFPAGIYFLRLETAFESQTIRMVYLP